MASKLTSSFERLVNAKRLPGIGAIVLDKSGKRLYDQSFSTINANDESAEGFTNDTELVICSCTKLITCICILQLLEQGKIASLDDPVAKYLPREADMQVCTGFDENGEPILRKPKTEMKLIHLMTHTAGYTYDFWESDEAMVRYRRSKEQPQGAFLPISAEWQYYDTFLAFDPGARYHYGINIDRLGFIVEEITGMPLQDYVAKNICEPLGMTKTGPVYTTENWLRTHLKQDDGSLIAYEPLQPTQTPWEVLLALLNDGTHPGTGKSILKPETINDYVFKDFIPHIGCSNGSEDVPGMRKAGSGGWAGLNNIYYWVDREGGKAGIIGTQIFPFLDPDCLRLFEEVERFAYA